ncbi:MAG TPA: GH25 family lysozyme [Gallionella sp.]|nr:GH25 family lysozyme [Gallionella sp.]
MNSPRLSILSSLPFLCRFAAFLLGLSFLAGCGQGSAQPAASAEQQQPASAGVTAQAVEIRGADVSNWQGKGVDFASLKSAGVSFVFVKATQGATGVDADYASDVRKAQAAGLATGSYHFYMTDDTPEAQFRNFSRCISMQAGDLPPVVDIEVLSKNSRPELAADLKRFLDMIERHYRVKPIIYSGESFANEYLKGFSDYPLWLAEYSDRPAPVLPLDWKTWTFWQHTQSGRVNGIPGEADLNRFNGNAQSLEKLLVRAQ